MVQLLHQPLDNATRVPIFELFLSLCLAHALNSSGFLQQVRQLATLGLQIRVPTNVLVVDENIRDGALLGDFLERVLDRCSVICFFDSCQPPRYHMSHYISRIRRSQDRAGWQRTDLIQLDDVGLRAQLAQQLLGGFAVWAPGFTEDGSGIVSMGCL